MKSIKYKFFFRQYGRLRGATLFTRNVFSGLCFFGIFIESTQFTTFFQFAIADSFVREVEFCTIVIHYSLKFNYTDDQSKELNIYTSIKKRYLSNKASLYRILDFLF